MIQVLIERYISHGMLSTYESNCRTALQQNYVAVGFIAGENFTDQDNENHRFLLCKWRSLADWKKWHRSRERLELMNTINPILDRPEKVTVLAN